MIETNKAIVFFDGYCVLCSNIVHFLLKHNKSNTLYFSTLQSDVAKEVLLQHALKEPDINSVLFLEKDQLYSQSTAALKILKHLSPLWQIFQIFWIVPKPFRNIVYQVFANKRYRWFGQKDKCFVPVDVNKERFIL